MQSETELTVECGSSALFRLMGGIVTSRWFPMTATVSAIGNGDCAEAELVGYDRKALPMGPQTVEGPLQW